MQIRFRHPLRLLLIVLVVAAFETGLRAIAQLAPALAEMMIPLYLIVAVAGLAAIWHAVRGRDHDRRGGDRRHLDRRHERATESEPGDKGSETPKAGSRNEFKDKESLER